MRDHLTKESQSMPDRLIIATGTVTGSFSGFLLPSTSNYVITEFVVDGIDISADMDLFPEDTIIPCNVNKVVLTGKIILFS